jgi:uncharacterized membrane protein/uncharacterized membrane protein YeaQ/YmgE (transglycosylase-associated protein family)
MSFNAGVLEFEVPFGRLMWGMIGDSGPEISFDRFRMRGICERSAHFFASTGRRRRSPEPPSEAIRCRATPSERTSRSFGSAPHGRGAPARHHAKEARMQLAIWIAVGLVAGWLAGLLMKGRDYGIAGNLILGLFGSLVGGWIMELLGFNAPGDLLRHGLVSLLGAMVVLGVARRLKPVSRQTRKVFGEVATVADLEAHFKRLGELERLAFSKLLRLERKPVDPNRVFEDQMTFGQRVADRVATFGGSWTFIGTFLLLMIIWMIVNTLRRAPFDPFPFILLNLMLSCLAALQAPVIMMSQNRQAAKDRLMATNDYEVNLRTEMDLARLHARFDELREQQWAAMVEMQQRQIEMLERLLREREGDASA